LNKQCSATTDQEGVSNCVSGRK